MYAHDGRARIKSLTQLSTTPTQTPQGLWTREIDLLEPRNQRTRPNKHGMRLRLCVFSVEQRVG